MPFVKVLKNGVITLPKKLRGSLGINDGEILEIEIKNSGMILKPKVMIDKTTETTIAEGLEDLEDGNFLGPFNSSKEFKETVTKE